MGLGGCSIGLVKPSRCLTHTRLHIPSLRIDLVVFPGKSFGLDGFVHIGGQFGLERLGIVRYAHPFSPFGGRFERFGQHHGNRLVIVVHLVVLKHVQHAVGSLGRVFILFRPPYFGHVLVRHHADYAGDFQGLARVDLPDATMRNGAHHQHAMHQIKPFYISRITGYAGHFLFTVDPVNRVTNEFLCHTVEWFLTG